MKTMVNHDRYSRQIKLPGIGSGGQEKLGKARVLVIGAGGLGCPVLQYLAGAGIGHLGIADSDRVEISNLHRQPLYRMEDIGRFKAASALSALQALNPDIEITPYILRITNQNALSILDGYDLIMDGTDNFVSSYVINDACVLLNKPLIYGAVNGFEGQVAFLNIHTGTNHRPNYRDIFPMLPGQGSADSCEDAGTIGIIPGIIGMLMATEAIKWITGNGQLLSEEILLYDGLRQDSYKFKYGRNEAGRQELPQTKDAFERKNYAPQYCNEQSIVEGIGEQYFWQLQSTPGVCFMDIRERTEPSLPAVIRHVQYPYSEWEKMIPDAQESTVVIFCQTGRRSQVAARMMQRKYPGKKIFSLEGGIQHLSLLK